MALVPGTRRALAFFSGTILLAVVSFFIIFYGMYPKAADPASVTAPSDPATVARGEYLATILGCVGCHSEQDTSRPGQFHREGGLMAGRTFAQHKDFPGTLVAPNITPHRDHGVGDWTDGELLRAIREGIRNDGSPIFPAMPYRAFQALPDADALAVVAWLRSLSAVPGDTRSDIELWAKTRARTVPQPLNAAVPPWPQEPVARGQLLMRLMGCWRCHTRPDPTRPAGTLEYSGGQRFDGPWGTVYAGNLTSHDKDGLGKWTDAQIAAVLKQGKLPDGRLAQAMPWSATAALNGTDLKAIVAALRAIGPAANRVPPPRLSQ